MPGYKHYVNSKVAGQLSYVTTTCLDWAHLFLRDEMKSRMGISLMRDCIKEQAKLYSFVVMSNHLHMVIKPNDQMVISTLMQRIKVNSITRIKKHFFAQEIAQLGLQEGLNRHQYWQNSFRGNPLFTKKVADQKTQYIHANPTRAKLVELPENYLWSSLHLIDLGFMKDDESLDLKAAQEYYKRLLGS